MRRGQGGGCAAVVVERKQAALREPAHRPGVQRGTVTGGGGPLVLGAHADQVGGAQHLVQRLEVVRDRPGDHGGTELRQQGRRQAERGEHPQQAQRGAALTAHPAEAPAVVHGAVGAVGREPRAALGEGLLDRAGQPRACVGGVHEGSHQPVQRFRSRRLVEQPFQLGDRVPGRRVRGEERTRRTLVAVALGEPLVHPAHRQPGRLGEFGGVAQRLGEGVLPVDARLPPCPLPVEAREARGVRGTGRPPGRHRPGRSLGRVGGFGPFRGGVRRTARDVEPAGRRIGERGTPAGRRGGCAGARPAVRILRHPFRGLPVGVLQQVRQPVGHRRAPHRQMRRQPRPVRDPPGPCPGLGLAPGHVAGPAREHRHAAEATVRGRPQQPPGVRTVVLPHATVLGDQREPSGAAVRREVERPVGRATARQRLVGRHRPALAVALPRHEARRTVQPAVLLLPLRPVGVVERGHPDQLAVLPVDGAQHRCGPRSALGGGGEGRDAEQFVRGAGFRGPARGARYVLTWCHLADLDGLVGLRPRVARDDRPGGDVEGGARRVQSLRLQRPDRERVDLPRRRARHVHQPAMRVAGNALAPVHEAQRFPPRQRRAAEERHRDRVPAVHRAVRRRLAQRAGHPAVAPPDVGVQRGQDLQRLDRHVDVQRQLVVHRVRHRVEAAPEAGHLGGRLLEVVHLPHRVEQGGEALLLAQRRRKEVGGADLGHLPGHRPGVEAHQAPSHPRSETLTVEERLHQPVVGTAVEVYGRQMGRVQSLQGLSAHVAVAVQPRVERPAAVGVGRQGSGQCGVDQFHEATGEVQLAARDVPAERHPGGVPRAVRRDEPRVGPVPAGPVGLGRPDRVRHPGVESGTVAQGEVALLGGTQAEPVGGAQDLVERLEVGRDRPGDERVAQREEPVGRRAERGVGAQQPECGAVLTAHPAHAPAVVHVAVGTARCVPRAVPGRAGQGLGDLTRQSGARVRRVHERGHQRVEGERPRGQARAAVPAPRP
ncbi:hypothetical protein GA0115235_11021, partial [Streptomyces sp. DpondAA-F4a]